MDWNVQLVLNLYKQRSKIRYALCAKVQYFEDVWRNGGMGPHIVSFDHVCMYVFSFTHQF